MKNVRPFVLCLLVLLVAQRISAQTENATITGRITDPTKAVVVGAQIALINTGTNVRYEGTTNSAGSYVITALPPGSYRAEVGKTGFKTIVETGLVLHVQDTVELNFEMALGAVSESITVEAGRLNINTTDAAVSTVVDREFIENLPMNGRSFQTLIYLTPGVVATPVSIYSSGQFSVNGQRPDSNSLMIDGASANVGMALYYFAGESAGGAVPATNVLGGYNSLVSVDAMQEFRVQTSTYAPEYGRQPGAQISIATRSGTNQFHGTAFEYFRNDVLDANDWFANANHLPKPQERQNDFGGVLGGPVFKDKTFFFFSYEGLRLRQPQVLETLVPSLSARSSASAAIAPYVNAFPIPNDTDFGDGTAQFNASFSNRAALNSTSLRIDQVINNKLLLFARYSYSPSENVIRGGGLGTALSNPQSQRLTTQTFTVGSTWQATATAANDLRFNYSHNDGKSVGTLDNFGGAVVPPDSAFYPTGYNGANAGFALFVETTPSIVISPGLQIAGTQQQFQLVDNYSANKGTHAIKVGVDYRHQSFNYRPDSYFSEPFFLDVPQLLSGTSFFSNIVTAKSSTLFSNNFGFYLQDTWRISPRLTVTYGLRWDLELPPSIGNDLPFIVASNVNDPANFSAAPAQTSPWRTTYTNFAPRVGVAYQLRSQSGRELVLRGGFGKFFDLLGIQASNYTYQFAGYPVGAKKRGRGEGFPFTPSFAAPPPIVFDPTAYLFVYDPHIEQPYTLGWNVALEQALGSHQTISASYVGAQGRKLLEQETYLGVNPVFGNLAIMLNGGTSDYHALQLQFQRRLSHGLQALASYTWSHSIDTSSGSGGDVSDLVLFGTDPNANRGPSSFDIRHSLSSALIYDIPFPKRNRAVAAILGDWSLDSIVLARSASPINVGSDYSLLGAGNSSYGVLRPDVVPDQPFYVHSASYPGGKAINPLAFAAPPTDANGNPIRQGTLGRNALRGFGATQWDLAVHRQFRFSEKVGLQFRCEMFNVLNHPNFGPPLTSLSFGEPPAPLFGQATQMLNQSLGGNTSGAVNALYQIGGPRSLQLALKLTF